MLILIVILFFWGKIEDEHEDDDENDFANAFFKQPLKSSNLVTTGSFRLIAMGMIFA
jgi:hypothetical protein